MIESLSPKIHFLEFTSSPLSPKNPEIPKRVWNLAVTRFSKCKDGYKNNGKFQDSGRYALVLYLPKIQKSPLKGKKSRILAPAFFLPSGGFRARDFPIFRGGQ